MGKAGIIAFSTREDQYAALFSAGRENIEEFQSSGGLQNQQKQRADPA